MLELLIALLISLNILSGDLKKEPAEAAYGKTKTEKPGTGKPNDDVTTTDGGGHVVTTWP